MLTMHVSIQSHHLKWRTFIEEMPHSDAGGSTYTGQLKNILFKPNATFFTKCVEMCKWSFFYCFNINTNIDTKQTLFHTA